MDILEYIKKMQEMYGEDVITTADKIKRPDPKPIVKEIEAFNEFMKRNPKADGGQLVAPSVDGSRPGYAKQTKDFKTNFVNIKDIKKYDKKLLNKSIIVSEIVSEKIGANQAERVTLKNIFNVVNRTKDGDKLIENFKKNPNAENLLKLKARRKNRISFEKQQALPPLEKIELRKRKRIAEQKWRNSGKGIKFYNNYLSQGGIFPARTAEERIWRDIYRASTQKKEKSRFILKYPKSANVDKISGLPQTVTSKITGKDYIPWDKFYKDITFYDTVTKKNIKFNTVKKWMTDNVQDGARKYDNAIKNYKASNVINTFEIDGVALSKLAKDKQKGVFAKRITTAAAVNHRSGLNNFWDTEVITSSGNKMLNEKVQANISAYKNASNPNIEKKLLNIMKQNAKKIKGGGTIVLDDKTVLGKKPTIKSVVSALEKELNVKIPLNRLTKLIEDLCPKGKASGGRIGYQDAGVVGKTLQCGLNQFNKNIKTGNANSVLMRRILANGGNILTSAGKQLNPAELLKLRNLIGPQALGFLAAYEAGVITDDVLRKGTPLNESVAKNWLTKSFVPFSEEFARQKNLLKSGTLNENQRIYALDMMKAEKAFKEMDRIEGMERDQLVEGTMDDDFIFNSQEKIDAAKTNVNRIIEDLDSRDSFRNTGKQMENIRAMDEMEASRMAKKRYSPFFGKLGTPLVNKLATPPGRRIGPMTAKKEMKIDFSLPTYDRMKTPTDQDILNTYRQYGIISPTEFKTGVLQPGEGTLIRMMQGGQGLYGTQFATGGIVGDKSGPPPTGGPMSQGLRSLYNNGKKL
jgi:hypothetical protein